jgi:hypothetical protein
MMCPLLFSYEPCEKSFEYIDPSDCALLSIPRNHFRALFVATFSVVVNPYTNLLALLVES